MSQKKSKALSTEKRRDDLEGFLLILKSRPTIQLQALARECNLDWAGIKKELEKRQWFFDAVKEVFEDYKVLLLGKMEGLALGSSKAGPQPNMTAIRKMISMLETGEIWSLYGIHTEEGEEDEDLTEEEKRRFGLTGE